MAIKPCTCKHEKQDKIHGKGQRVKNLTREEPGPQFRCTVCMKESK